HMEKMKDLGTKLAEVARKDGDPEAAFRSAAKVIERTYTAPFLAHNTMEPMNFFAHVTPDKAELIGPIQTPEAMEKSVAARLDMPLEKIDIQMSRQGGGFGRRLYGHFIVEAAVISQKMNAPVKLVYSREDDMTFGTYRPTYHATYRAALDADNNLVAFHVRAGGIPESPLFADRFPAGAVDHYLAERWSIDSNISVGAFRAPRSNFIAGAEQSFLDEVAEAAGKDPIAFRLELLERAKANPVGERNDYDAARYAGVLELVRDKSNWNDGDQSGVHRGVSAYFCHNSYVAQVLDLVMENGKPKIEKVHCAVDCGIVVNPLAATNLVEGGTVDGIGHALYSGLTFKEGTPEQNNFDKYRLIRHGEAPKSIEVHFVENEIDPTGLGEPPFPPVMGAMANALYKATGNRYYQQPLLGDKQMLG
ncbi:MAG: xanthine dehydrogenase family protein molybdopterin-binding subunit, partial [Saprospiraceae bacterium]|nr:xanthine dehydrogenase family protein molybdopterin-binding subunit [Saprospiraceae bacterium]